MNVCDQQCGVCVCVCVCVCVVSFPLFFPPFLVSGRRGCGVWVFVYVPAYPAFCAQAAAVVCACPDLRHFCFSGLFCCLVPLSVCLHTHAPD